jgi:hypothetical protein
VVGDDQAKHGVTEELEPLVRLVPWVLGTPRTVRESRGQRRLVGNRPSEPLDQRGEPGDWKRLDDQPLPKRATT